MTSRTQRMIRTGSALVLVIGALALISVFAAIYLAIGRGDRANAVAFEQRSERNDYSDFFADYIAGVIRDDRLDVYPIRTVNPRDTEYYREVVDYPYTDWSVRTQPDNEWERFLPSGRHIEEFPGGQANDPRVPYDPWLASTEPEYLGSENILAGQEGGVRSFSNTFSFGGGEVLPGRRFLDNRDWRQISNVSPDGRFVNLFNLRPSLHDNTDTRGGFDARPGFGTYQVDGVERRSMSHLLSLLNRQGNGDSRSNQLPRNPRIQAFDPTENGRAWIPGYDAPQAVAQALGIRPEEIVNVPAVWTMNQRYLFSPANQPFYTYDRYEFNTPADWSSPDFMAYQYADADGDGMYDSRWFELVDASDARTFKNLLPVSLDEVRLFAAVRVEDLAARVNINAHGDGLIAPTYDFASGSSPAEVDLRRLLGLEDVIRETAGSFNELDAFPSGADAVSSYEEYFPFSSDPSLRLNGQRILNTRNDGPAAFNTMIADTLSPRNLTQRQSAESMSHTVGWLAYDAIRLSLEAGIPPGEGVYGPDQGLAQSNPNLDYPSWIGLLATNDLSIPNETTDRDRVTERIKLSGTSLITTSRFAYRLENSDASGQLGEWEFDATLDPAKRRALYYDQVGLGVPGSYVDKLSPFSDEVKGQVFSLGELTELLTFRGLNDPAVFSRLEQATAGRTELEIPDRALPNDYPIRQVSRRFDPLMSNRPLELDRFAHANGRLKTKGSLNETALFNFPGPIVTGAVDEDSMWLLHASPRLRLTTYSGAVPLPSGSPVRLNPQTLRVPAMDEGTRSAVPVRSVLGSTSIAFNVYARTLLRDSTINNYQAWRRNQIGLLDRRNAGFAPLAEDTLFYGAKGPELALRLSAHLAVNLQDQFDEDFTPTVETLLVDRSAIAAGFLDPGGYNTTNSPTPWFVGDTNYVRPVPVEDRDGTLRGTFNELRNGLDYGISRDPELFPNNSRIPEGVLPNSSLEEQSRLAVNVFGVEPSPVLSEVAIVNVFTDAPEEAGGDRDYFNIVVDANGNVIDQAPEPDPGGGPGGGAAGPGNTSVTLDTSVPAATSYLQATTTGNSDFLFQALVFQVHNPYPEAITFGGYVPLARDDRNNPDALQNVSGDEWDQDPDPAGSSDRDFSHYIEYGGRFFRLGAYEDYTQVVDPTTGELGLPTFESIPENRYRRVILEPNDTKVFYVLMTQEDTTPGANPNIQSSGVGLDWKPIEDRAHQILAAYPSGQDLQLVLDRFRLSDETGGNINAANQGWDNNQYTGLVQEWFEKNLANNLLQSEVDVDDRTIFGSDFYRDTLGALDESDVNNKQLVTTFNQAGNDLRLDDDLKDFGMKERVSVHRMREVSPVTGRVLQTQLFQDLAQRRLDPINIDDANAEPVSLTGRNSTSTVRLWQVIRGTNEPATGLNQLSNDLLNDRIEVGNQLSDTSFSITGTDSRIDGTFSLGTIVNQLVAVNSRVNSDDPNRIDPFEFRPHVQGIDPPSVGGTRLRRNDDTGWTIARWAGVRRGGRPFDEFNDREVGSNLEFIERFDSFKTDTGSDPYSRYLPQRGSVQPVMLAGSELDVEFDPEEDRDLDDVRAWVSEKAPRTPDEYVYSGTSSNPLSGIAPSAFRMVDSPNFKYRLLDMLAMGFNRNALSDAEYPAFDPLNPAGYLDVPVVDNGDDERQPIVTGNPVTWLRTAEGPVLEGMPFHPDKKYDALREMYDGTSDLEYIGATPSANDIENYIEFDEPRMVKAIGSNEPFDLDYANGPDANPDRVNPDLGFGMRVQNSEKRYTLRASDLLLPFAVGPVQAPKELLGRGNQVQNYNPDDEWLTFPETLAIALGFRKTPDPSAVTNGRDAMEQLYGLLWDVEPGQSVAEDDTKLRAEPLLNGGKLRTDRFVGFLDFTLDPTQTDPLREGYAGRFDGNDLRRGTGIPIALELLSEVRTIGRDATEQGTTGSAIPPGVGATQIIANERVDRLRDMVVGKININTAPESVLRLLPEMSPSVEFYDAFRDNGFEPNNAFAAGYWAASSRLRTLSLSDPAELGVPGYAFAGPPNVNNEALDLAGLTTDNGKYWPDVTAVGTPNPDGFVVNNPAADLFVDDATGFRDRALASVRDTPDRAAVLAAYRDRRRAWPRLFSDPVTAFYDASNALEAFSLGIDFTPFTADNPVPWRQLAQFTNEDLTTSPVPLGVQLHVSNYSLDRTRQILTGIDGLRETPGFGSVGEVLAVTLRTDDAVETPAPAGGRAFPYPLEGRSDTLPANQQVTTLYNFNKHNLMTGLAHDGVAFDAALPFYFWQDQNPQPAGGSGSTSPGARFTGTGTNLDALRAEEQARRDRIATLDPSVYLNNPQDGLRDQIVSTSFDNQPTFDTPVTDTVADEEDEAYAVARSILNSIDVRSDTFAVWFVLQAYRPEDVADLAVKDPLVPSFERRFVMVIDRSSVITETDKPEIVLLREVPL